MPQCAEDNMTRAFSIAVVLSMLAVCVPSSLAWAEEGQINSCEILADWDQQWDFSGMEVPSFLLFTGIG